MRVLLIEPWYGGSHRAWADGWIAHSSHDVGLVTLPDRFWRRRLRVGAAELVAPVAQWVSSHGRPDALVVSSMVDLASLAGLCRRSLGDVELVMYCHENQLVYPHPEQVASVDVDAAARSLQSLLAADRVLVNSHHHLGELHRGARRVIADSALDGGAVDRRARDVLESAVVVPVGVDLGWCVPTSSRPAPIAPGEVAPDLPLVLWPHRWDADKAPEVMVRSLERLGAEGIAFGVVLAGEDGWRGDVRRADAVARLGGTVVAHGHLSVDEYRRWVRRADVVLSTAQHEYFGTAVVEALAAGAIPVLPDRCSYPEIVPVSHHRVALYPDGGLGRHLRSVLADVGSAREATAGLAHAMQRFGWDVVAPQLDAVLTVP